MDNNLKPQNGMCIQRVTHPDGNVTVQQVPLEQAFLHRNTAMEYFLMQDVKREKGEEITDEIEIFNFVRDKIKPRPFSFDEKKDGVTLHYEYL